MAAGIFVVTTKVSSSKPIATVVPYMPIALRSEKNMMPMVAAKTMPAEVTTPPLPAIARI